MTYKNTKYLILGSVLLILTGCNQNDTAPAITLDNELASIITSNNLTGNPIKNLTLPSISDPKAKLGMKLFFTKSLGGIKDSACVSCHHPSLGGGDNLSLPIGIEAINSDVLGQGRIYNPSGIYYDNGFALVPRNAPSTYNVALWKRSLFWDGRVENIIENGVVKGIRTPDSDFGTIDSKSGANLAVAQARFPVTSRDEMRSFFEENSTNEQIRTHLALRLSDITASDYIANTWQEEFLPIYGENSINYANIADAIGEYERSQVFVNNPWNNYVKGAKNAISDSAKRGAKLFFNSYGDGGMSCVSCHSSDFFSDEKFHAMAMPQVGVGKNDNADDLGRFNVTKIDKYAFRTPSLLNVEMTGPWGHSGAYVKLESVVRHMVNPEKAIQNYDTTQLNENVKTQNLIVNTNNALAQLKSDRIVGISTHQSVDATDTQINDLVSFLQALTDPCVKDKECIGKWIPKNELGPDSLQLNATDKNGNLL